MVKIPEKVLEWREKKKPGEIMSPETFERIKREAAKRGAESPEAVAGAAYWRTALAKYKKGKKSPVVARITAIQRRIGRG